MKIVTLFCILVFLLNSIELSSQVFCWRRSQGAKVCPAELIIHQTCYYEDEQHVIRPITGYAEVGIDGFGYINGVVIKNKLRPLCNRIGRIVIQLSNRKSYPLMPRTIHGDVTFGQKPRRSIHVVFTN